MAEADSFRELSFLEDAPGKDTPNRLCVTLSDTHFTDRTVGVQNLSGTTWDFFFDSLEEKCRSYAVGSFYLVIAGDVVDLIRSGRWAEAGVYPWQRDHPDYPAVLESVMRGILDNHADFFHELQELPRRLRENAGVDHVRVLPLLGNHDKEVVTCDRVLAMYYREGFGIEPEAIDTAYRRWVGAMYFNDPTRFEAPGAIPWPAFYFADRGFRYFTTHGHWRDPFNSRAVPGDDTVPGWQVRDGWRLDRWQSMEYAPFIRPCFGDAVAGGLLSGFIRDMTRKLEAADIDHPRLNRILRELDLYRPAYLGVQRVMKESGRLRREEGERGMSVGGIIEEAMYDWVTRWLSWSFTRQSASRLLRAALAPGYWIIRAAWGVGLQRHFIRALMTLLQWIESREVDRKPSVDLDELKMLPAFLPQYRHYRLQIHGEGHTHQPLQEEPNLGGERNSTYINFGTWRDRIVQRRKQGYRRRSVLRAFFILDLSPTAGAEERSLYYYTKDMTVWGDHLDDISRRDGSESTDLQELF